MYEEIPSPKSFQSKFRKDYFFDIVFRLEKKMILICTEIYRNFSKQLNN